MKEFRDPYKILMVDPEADRDVIQAAYRQLARKYHPDRGLDLPPNAAGKMVELNAAWELLGDPERRADYDRERAAANRSSWPGPATATTTRNSPPRSTDGFAPRTASSSRAANPPPAPGEGGQWAGPPPGRASGSVLNFGRYSGWSLGEIARVEPAYLDWLERMPIGRSYRSELQAMLREMRAAQEPALSSRKGRFGRG